MEGRHASLSTDDHDDEHMMISPHQVNITHFLKIIKLKDKCEDDLTERVVF